MNKKYKHLSLDIWLTLIRSNPKFKEERNKNIFENYNSKDLSYDEVCKIVRSVDVKGNKKSEVTGIHVDSMILLYDILMQLNEPEIVTNDLLQQLDLDVQNLFLRYTPSLYDENTKSDLEAIHAAGITLSILSNTGFIKAETLEETFKKLGILNLFSFTLFSDEMNVSKPNIKAFIRVKNGTSGIYFREPVEILHVGDNPIADGGSTKADIDFFQINTNDKTLTDVRKIFITQN